MSPSTVSGCSGSPTTSSCRLASISGRLVSMARATTSARSTRSRCSVIAPRVMRATSSRSSISLTRCSTWRSITSRAFDALRLGQFLEPQQVHRRPDGRQRISDLVRQHGQEFVLAAVGLPQRLFPIAQIRGRGLQLRRSLGDALLELAIQPLELPRLAKQIHEDADLRPQNLGNDRNRHVVDRAARVSLEPVEIRQMHAGDEDDRRLLKARMLAHHRRPARTRRAPACRHRSGPRPRRC